MTGTDWLLVLLLSILGSWISTASWVLALDLALRLRRRREARQLAAQVEEHLRGRQP